MLKAKITLGVAILLACLSLAGFFLPQQSHAQKKNVCAGVEINFDSQDCEPTYNDQGQCVNAGGSVVNNSECESSNRINSLVTNIVNIFSIIVGIVAVVMIVWSGFRYVTSAGDSSNITAAKTTIIYAIIGIIVVVLAQTIVRFVIGKA